MKRKTFLELSSALALGGIISPLSGCKNESQQMETPTSDVVARTNWAKNYTYKAEQLHRPKSAAEVQELVKQLDQQKALGTCHCFNDIADSPKHQISTQDLKQVIGIDEENKTITVQAGAKYGEIAPILQERGFALHNLASLPHISVAGACATGTHGSGVSNGNLPSAVRALEMVNGKGELIKLQRGDEGFSGAVVGLGALGIVTQLTLDIEKTFDVRQDVFQDLPLESLQENFEDIMSAGYSVSLFTDWTKKLVSQVWVKRRTDREVADLGTDFYGAKAATRDLHPITRLSAVHCTEQMGKPGPWHERLPHFKMGFTPSSGDELQSEFFVPFENGLEAMMALEKQSEKIFPHLLISEIRTIAADDYWMSPAYQQKSLAIHFTWKPEWPAVKELIPMIEAELAPFGVRPHWGKLFTVPKTSLHERYPKMQDFLQMVQAFDPQGKFRNEYLDLNIYSS